MTLTGCSRRACLAHHPLPPCSTSVRRWQNTAATSSRTRSRARDGRNRADVDVSNVDLVGPPDPLSNIRPMYYAPVPSTSQATTPSKSVQPPLPHPYSLSEFSQVSRGGGKSIRAGFGLFKAYRDYVERVRSKVEEAEMKLRVSKLSTDSITQRFWKDNNTRFSRDLQSWREESQRRIAGHGPVEVIDDNSTAMTKEMSREEATFYANWLKANGRRNRLYNVLVWKQAWDQVRLGGRVAYLRNWLRTLQVLEGR